MTAQQAPENEWFMVLRTTKWYKKMESGNMYTNAKVIGDKKVYMIPNDEPVKIL